MEDKSARDRHMDDRCKRFYKGFHRMKNAFERTEHLLDGLTPDDLVALHYRLERLKTNGVFKIYVPQTDNAIKEALCGQFCTDERHIEELAAELDKVLANE